MNEVILFKKS